MRLATWNVNSIRARWDNVRGWLETAQPDILLLQEIKTEDDGFPHLEAKAAGYDSAVYGQKSYNGVAILSRHKIQTLQRGLPTLPDDPQARYIEAEIAGLRVASLYAPNGNPVPATGDPTSSEKYAYKLDWMHKFKKHAQDLMNLEIPVILGGDFNVIAEPRDCYDFASFSKDALGLPQTRAAFREWLNLGYVAAFRAHNPDATETYSFWDYQGGAFARNLGLRLDDFLLTPEAADRLLSCTPDPAPRAQDKASDHTPVVIELA